MYTCTHGLAEIAIHIAVTFGFVELELVAMVPLQNPWQNRILA
jgi:hypothetical protein